MEIAGAGKTFTAHLMIAGIDLGTTNSLIGVMDSGFPILLADAHGHRLTPSVVHFPEHGEPIVGREAQRLSALHPERTVSSVKRWMGRELDPSAPPILHTVAPTAVSAAILKHLRTIAESALETGVHRAVITVPAYFNDSQRAATKAAGEAAGFAVERILNEPTAAALACGLDKCKAQARVAVYDLGGGTFDITILERRDGIFHVLATGGDTRLGGDDIDQALVEWLLNKWQLDAPDATLLARIREAAVVAKHKLSTSLTAEIQIPFSRDGHHHAVLSRAELDRLAQPWIARTRACCLRALADARIQADSLNEILLVGGSTRMPIVRDFVSDFFQREPLTAHNPDEAVAMGAVIQGGILSGQVRDVVLLDVTPLSLGIETFGGLMNVIIPRNTTIPTKAGELFTNAVSGQQEMRIRVLQGERELAKDNWPLGDFDIPFQPAPKGQARVGVQFEIDADGILHVLARDTVTGQQMERQLSSAVDVSDERVEQMIAESVEFALDDMTQRRFEETKLKSQEMLRAVEKAIQSLNPPPETVACVRALTCAVEDAMEKGDLHGLLKANQALDAGTQELASALMDKALDAAIASKLTS